MKRAGAARAAAWTALAIAFLTQAAVSISDQAVATLTAFIAEDLGLSTASAGLLVAALPAGRAFGSYGAGRAVDAVGERRVMIAGAAAMACAVLVAAASPPAAVAALFFAAGACASTTTPAGGKMVLLAFSSRHRATAMGVRQTAIPIGGLVAALTVPWIAAASGWRTALAAAGALTALGTGLAWAALTVRRASADPASAVAGPEAGSAVWRDPNVLLLTLWAMMLVGGQYVIVAFLPLYLHDKAGMALPVAATMVAVVQAGGIAGRLAWGLLSDRVFAGRRRPVVGLMTITGSAAFLLLAVLPGDAPTLAFAFAAALGGASILGWQTIFVVTLAEFAGPERAGTATGFSLTWVAIGIALAPPVYGAVAEIAGSLSTMWAAIALVSFIALIPGMLVEEPGRSSSADPDDERGADSVRYASRSP